MGAATRFVSHAWDYVFQDLLAALLALGVEQEYLWIGATCARCLFRTTHDTAPACSADVFVLNQHEAATIERPPDWWSDAFSDAVRTVGHTLLVLQPWFAPRALQRAWCLWEIFCTLQGGIQLDVLLNPGQVEAFRDNLARADVSCLHARNALVTDAYAHAVIGF